MHNHVNAAAQTDRLSNTYTVKDIELNLVFSDRAFHSRRQFFFQFFRLPNRIKKEGTALFNASEQVIVIYIRLSVTSDKIGTVYQIRHIDRAGAEAQVRYGYAAGFFRIVSKVCLCIHIRVITDDLDSTLVCADRSVRTEAPELTSFQAFSRQINFFFTR